MSEQLPAPDHSAPQVLFATSEVYPLVKTGGLADVSASLPEALCSIGFDVRLLLPGYPVAMDKARQTGLTRLAELEVQGYPVTLWQGQLPGTGVELWLVACDALFARPGGPYQDPDGQGWPDNARRFQLFCEVASRIALGRAGLAWKPDLVHCNDWQTALIPALLSEEPDHPGTVFTIHNLAYQGLFPEATFRELCLPAGLWSWDRLEFHGQVSFIKGGLVYADQVTTVSPGYAREILTPEFGYGLDGLLRHRESHLTGILNGIDDEEWNPARDRYLPAHYDAVSIRNKARCKRDLLEQSGLDQAESRVPLLGFIGRLVPQKGIDLIGEILPWLLEQQCRVVILGSGLPEFEEQLQSLARTNPGRLSITIGYDESLAHRITAGCDLFMMPSRFEPCGLNQMYSLRYGTVPVVHRVGGLGDTVFDPASHSPGRANGFTFDEPTAESFQAALVRALTLFRDRRRWRKLQANGLTADFSWTGSARAYAGIYQMLAGFDPEGAGTHGVPEGASQSKTQDSTPTPESGQAPGMENDDVSEPVRS